jgi:hypothetical protein
MSDEFRSMLESARFYSMTQLITTIFLEEHVNACDFDRE